MGSWRSIMGVDAAEELLAQNPQYDQKPAETQDIADIEDIADGDLSEEALIRRAFRQGQPVRVWSGVLQEWIWWAPSKEAACRKRRETDEVVYHVGELNVMLDKDRQSMKDLHELKKGFDGEIIE